MDRNLALEVVRVTEAAALAAARFVGRGDEIAADQEAAEAVRRAFRAIPVRGEITVGEGPEEAGVALYDGERVGSGAGPELRIAVDAIEGATACASGAPNAISIIAIADETEGGFMRCPPRAYMDKIVVGTEGREVVSLDASPAENLKRLAEARGVYVEDLTVAILDRPRNQRVIDEVRNAGARIRLLIDGEVSACLATTRADSGIELVMGIGGASQGILAASALLCAGGQFQSRFVALAEREKEELRSAGIQEWGRTLALSDLVQGSVMFAATGITTGESLRGVRFFKGGAKTNSIVMRSRTRTVRLIEATHRFDFKPEY